MGTVKIAAIWSDIDVIRIQVSAKSELFSASTVVYTTDELLRTAAENVSGFPVGVNDKRSFDLSTTTDDRASFELRCLSLAGNAILEIYIRNSAGAAPEEAQIVIPAFPALLDQFATELRSMAARAASVAVLGE